MTAAASRPRPPPFAAWTCRCRAILLVLIGALLLALPHQAVAADPGAQDGDRYYDIEALPLDLALARFSEVSGIDILLREPNVTARRSTPVLGRMTPAEALMAMLEGTGLVARFTSASSAIVVPVERANEPWITPSAPNGEARALLNLDMMRVTAPRMVGTSRAQAEEIAYAQRLVVAIRRRVMDEKVFVGGESVDVRVATRIDPGGALRDVRIVRGSLDRAADRRLLVLLESADLGLVPPAVLRQPLIFDVSGR